MTHSKQSPLMNQTETDRPHASLPGKFIVFEGIDGAGTTTQAQALVNHLKSEGISAYLTYEPSESSIGTFTRQALQGKQKGYHQKPLPDVALALLFAADRADHWYNDIKPHLEQGTYVICDRYLYSSLAYQGLFHPLQWVSTINGYYPQPDLLFYLHVDAKLASFRRQLREQQPDLYEKDELQIQISKAYETIFDQLKHYKIDGSQSISSIHAQCVKAVKQL